ncbi:SRPBCC family protein [Sphingobacterium sp. 1.A.4]|uniref:SRPBCC family protein n=1 Tax=Sphingobacterium sp. 1.A.4 TaxID=2044603 RepID=UPI000C0BF4B5|nr:SRPBCC family protein [Sphingobacterium sp. 1.A.4]
METQKVKVQSAINAPLKKVWEAYNNPEDIVNWNQASPDWHCPSSENDLRVGGKFKNKMAAKDGSFEFDFEGTYTEVTPYNYLSYVLGDERTADVRFSESNGQTLVDVLFDAEGTNPVDMQREGWQAILNSFKDYVENK